jgi:hypothetical protein
MIYEELEKIALPFMEAYKEDLTTIDRKAIEYKPGVPFLHYTRKWGTTISFLPAADSPLFPPAGVRVPYLFGTADREHLLNECLSMAKHCAPENDPPFLCVCYFDGHKLRKTNFKHSRQIAEDYARSVRAAWNKLAHKPNRYGYAVAA